MSESQLAGAIAKESTFDYIKNRQNQTIERINQSCGEVTRAADSLFGPIPKNETEASLREQEAGHLGDVRYGMDQIAEALDRLDNAVNRLIPI